MWFTVALLEEAVKQKPGRGIMFHIVHILFMIDFTNDILCIENILSRNLKKDKKEERSRAGMY